jgi:hypothetical protein
LVLTSTPRLPEEPTKLSLDDVILFLLGNRHLRVTQGSTCRGTEPYKKSFSIHCLRFPSGEGCNLWLRLSEDGETYELHVRSLCPCCMTSRSDPLPRPS